MSETLLQTKLYIPPLRSNLVPRPRLTERLDQGLQLGHKVALISAPAGFGKTTCIVEWLESINLPVAWLSLDPADDDPGRFFAYLVAALQQVDEQLGRDIESVLQAGQLPPGDIVVANLVNDILHFGRRFLLVLDDFQVIQDPFILQVLQTFVACMPSALYLVLLTREEPSLPLARVRANNQMTEVRAADLRFTSQETTLFLNEVMGLSLDPADILALDSKTEGWVVGLQLAGLSIRNRTDTATFITDLSDGNRHILSYLTEEVLNRQPEQIQSFLLQTSILDKLTGELCDAVTGGDDGQILLEQLLNDNLFLIPLDGKGQWYRYHQFFADLLRSRQQVLHGDETAELHRRASRWYAQAQYSTEAIQHALDAADYEMAVSLIETQAMDRVLAWHSKTVKGWMKAIPPQWTAKSPRINLAFAWIHLPSRNLAQVMPYIERLQELFAEPALTEADPALAAEWLALQATLLSAQGQQEESLTLAQQALTIVPQAEPRVTGLIYSGLATTYRQMNDYPRAVEAYRKLIQLGRTSGSIVSELMGYSGLGLYALERGELYFALEIALEGVERVERSETLSPISAAVYGELGSIYFHWYEIKKAHPNLARATEVSALSGYSDAEIYHHVIHSRLAQIAGDLEQADDEVQAALELMRLDAPAAVREEVVAQQVRVALARDRLEEAEAALTSYGLVLRGEYTPPEIPTEHGLVRPTGLLYLSVLQLLLYQALREGDPAILQRAIQLADHLLTKARADQVVPIVLETLLLRAGMVDALGDEPAGQADVIAALEVGQPEGFITIFLEGGQLVANQLTRLLEGDQLDDKQDNYARRILNAFPEPFQSAARSVPAIATTGDSLVEPLSQREIEVLQLIKEGFTNQDIAERLTITLHTVKKHSSNIYGKLGVSNRTQAVARARDLQLL